MPVFIREICYVPYSQAKVREIVRQLCSSSYKRHVCVSLTQNSIVRVAGIDIKEAYCLGVSMPNSDESVSRWKSNCIHAWKFANDLTSSRVPDSGVRVLVRPICEESPVGWVLWPNNIRLIVKVDRIKLNSVVIPWTTCGGEGSDDNGQTIGC